VKVPTSVLQRFRRFGFQRCLQLSPDFLLQYLGNSPEAIRRRAQVAAAAQASMRSKFACHRLPAFLRAVHSVMDRAYPAWYKDLFFSETPTTY
jgi:hypothetical protein